jgi:hypothetical protein
VADEKNSTSKNAATPINGAIRLPRGSSAVESGYQDFPREHRKFDWPRFARLTDS